MENIDPRQDRRLDRRTMLKRGLIAGGLLAGGGAAIAAAAQSGGGSGTPTTARSTPQRTPSPPRSRPPAPRRPNILVILVDQLRFPQWFSPAPYGTGLPPNLERLSEGAVSFARHYTASNDCSPARSTLLTGLYTHQTGCMITGGSTLDPGFPTWGTMLREHGYATNWFGKWHLTHGDNHWTPFTGGPALERYGFAGGVYPSPNGAPGQGWRVDPHISRAFEDWFAEEAGSRPWCTTVSFVNPHDIAWWYKWSDRIPAEASARHLVGRLPPNYETPAMLQARGKPRLQRSFQETAAASFGAVPFTGPEAGERWLAFLDLYVKIQLLVDRQIGRVMRTLESRPEVAANTVIVFTSDHGEYGASHGLRGKGASAYEEGIRVPLIVKDPRGVLTSEPARQRTQLTSSVDVAPLLLTIASGSDAWRRDPHYAHLAGRADLAAILADPSAPGREYVLHATDEIVTEFAIEPYAADAPLHIVALRTPSAKYAVYSNWSESGITPLAAGQEAELYDYSAQAGRLELHNSAGHSALEAGLRVTHERATLRELHAPLPQHLQTAHTRGFADYFRTARKAAFGAAASRKRRGEREDELEARGLPPDTELRHRQGHSRLPYDLRPVGPAGPLKRGPTP
ncbi:MAG TPA: sulfatase-like hydrolase/transferase [Solirubrobacteraceae bacterium]|nr:sulfatase-like hydrolase/transferase [Solirubrobacteraceae bacterium]